MREIAKNHVEGNSPTLQYLGIKKIHNILNPREMTTTDWTQDLLALCQVMSPRETLIS